MAAGQDHGAPQSSRRARRAVRSAGKGLLIGVGVLITLAVLVLVTLTNTGWGREQLRGFVLGQFEDVVDGTVEVGRIDGNLLVRPVLRDIRVEDAEGRPFLDAETVAFRYSIRSLLRESIHLSDLELRNVHLVLDEVPEDGWNFLRIFDTDPPPDPDPDAPPTWGAWVEFRDLRIVDGRVTLRTEWRPDEDLPPAEREEEVRQALAGESRLHIEAVPGGYQSVMEFRELHAHLPRILAAHPDTTDIPVEVSTATARIQPFQPPAGELVDLSGTLRIAPEAIRFVDVDLVLPASRLRADGVFETDTGTGLIELHADPLALDDLAFLHLGLPGDVEARTRLAVRLTEAVTHVTAEDVDVRSGRGSVEGRVEVLFGDTLRVEATHLAFHRVHTRLIEDFVPTIEIPVHGELSGQVDASAESGSLATPVRGLPAGDGPVRTGIDLDAWLQFDGEQGGTSRVLAHGVLGPAMDPADMELRGLTVRLDPLWTAHVVPAIAPDAPIRGSIEGFASIDGPATGPYRIEGEILHLDPSAGVSRVRASGGIGFTEGLRLDDLRIELDSLQVPAVLAAASELPVGGTLMGRARLDGDPSQGMEFHAELVHEDGEDHSFVVAEGEVATAGDGWISADLEVHSLPLALAGRFTPEAELRGGVVGSAHVEGTFSNLRVATRLELPDDGHLELEGAFDLAAVEPAYHVRLDLRSVNIAALSGRMPESTALSGSAAATGSGTDPETMQVDFEVDLRDEAQADPYRLRLAGGIHQGLARLDSLELSTRASSAQLAGTFGLTENRAGELAFEVALDSLHVFAPYLRADPALVEPRPGVRATAIETVEERRIEALRAGEVEFLATGQEPTLPEPDLEESLGILGIPADALAGSMAASGSVRGNVERFDMDARVAVTDLLAGGHHVRSASAELSLGSVGTPEMTATVEAAAAATQLAGFAYDSLFVRGEYRQPAGVHTGATSISIFQDPDTRIHAEAGFEMVDQGVVVRMEQLALDFEDASYRMPEPATLTSDETGVDIADFVLRSDLGALVQVEGHVPREGEGEVGLRIHDFEIAHVQTLLQERAGIRGRAWVEGEIAGTLAEPRVDANASMVDLRINGEEAPDLHLNLAYLERALRTEGHASWGGETILTLEAAFPLDLAFMDVPDTRRLEGPIRAEAHLISFPLERVSPLTDVVEGLTGWVSGEFTLAGTFEDPVTEGGLEVVVPSVYVVPLGIWVSNVAGAARFADDVVRVDSLVAHSRGEIRVEGEVDLVQWTEPAFDLSLVARDARIMNTEEVRLRVDADLTMSGPFEAVEVAGDVRTRSGVIRIPETRELAAPGPLDLEDPATFARVDRILVEARDALIQPSPLVENLNVALELFIERDVWIRSTEANVEIHTPAAIGPLAIRMNGIRPEDLRLEGTIDTDRGEYEFMGRRFNIARGSLMFTGEEALLPLIRLTAEHEVQLPGREAFDIRIILDGTPLDLTTRLESTAQPPPSETDLLSLVVFGREAGSLLQHHGSTLSGQGAAGGPLVGNVAARATQQFATMGFEALMSEIEAETAQALGLDVLHIQPTDHAAEIFTGRAADVLRGTEIQAGRYVTPRLFVSGQARPTFVHPGAVVEYQTDAGYIWRASWRPRFLPSVPSLAPTEPERASVFGTFLLREWRF